MCTETNLNLVRIRHKVTTELSRYSRSIARYGNHTNDVIVIALHAHDLKLRAARYIRAQRTMKLVGQLIPVPPPFSAPGKAPTANMDR